MTWFCRMRSPGEDLEDPYTDSQERQAAFAAWLRASPRHVWAYFQAAEHFKELRKHAPPTTTAPLTAQRDEARDTMTSKSKNAHRGLRLTASTRWSRICACFVLMRPTQCRANTDTDVPPGRSSGGKSREP